MEGRGTAHRKIDFFWLLLRLVLGGIFVYASYYKIVSPGAFAHQIYNFKLLPVWAINPAALILPWLQLLCGLALIFNRWPVGASFWLMMMMIVFQTALASALLRGLNIACGCFNTGGSPATWMTFGRDALILGAAVAQFWKSLRLEK